MNNKKQIALELEGLNGLKSLVEVYQEVAATRMQKVRGSVLQSRLFTDGLVSVFARVRSAYRGMKKELMQVRRLNGRTVAVLVSANSGLYGDIVEKSYERFEEFVLKTKPDVVVLGRQGSKMVGDRMPQILFNYFDFPDENIDMESFNMIMRYLIQFERIAVFHGKFQSILQQNPVQTNVSGESIVLPTGETEKPVSCLFEPNVEAIAKIFEGEILSSIFEQSLYESMLSKQASRMQALDRSLQNVEIRLGRVRFDERKLNHVIKNRKQRSTISGFVLWN